MTQRYKHSNSTSPRGVSRRDFLVLAAGLLAGCTSTQQPDAAPTTKPTTEPIIKPTAEPTIKPTTEPTIKPTTEPTIEPTIEPTTTPLPTMIPRRQEIIKTHPDAPSKVVHTHAGVWDGETLAPGALRQMLDASITALTGLNDATTAWAALFAPDERIAIKVNTIAGSRFWTHVPLVMAVTECLQEAGVPAEQIVIFDRYTIEMEDAGYPINKDGPGVRCHGTDRSETPGWQLLDTDIKFSDVLLNCNALINMPILKQHGMSGISFAMKNHYGTFDRPSSFHVGDRINRGLAELNALPPIKERTRLIIGDALNIVRTGGGGWYSAETGDSILMSFDPVAHDATGLQLLSKVWAFAGYNPDVAIQRATPWLENGAALGLGTNDPANMELIEQTLG